MILATLAVIAGLAVFFVSVGLIVATLDMDPPPGGRGSEIWFPAFAAVMGLALAASPFL